MILEEEPWNMSVDGKEEKKKEVVQYINKVENKEEKEEPKKLDTANKLRELERTVQQLSKRLHRTNSFRQERKLPSKDLVCFQCHQPGYRMRDCPKPIQGGV